MHGNRINERTQLALSRVLEELGNERMSLPKTKIMNISFSGQVPRIGIGIGQKLFK